MSTCSHECPICEVVIQVSPYDDLGDNVCPHCGAVLNWEEDLINDNERVVRLTDHLSALLSSQGKLSLVAGTHDITLVRGVLRNLRIDIIGEPDHPFFVGVTFENCIVKGLSQAAGRNCISKDSQIDRDPAGSVE